ncbi:transcription factor 20 [Syngnathoides biaculeatus]|uniref:transcription factor 20 n=1 Tax=Syngnathoides biaculeatus TaxID=300417 RepID=UPI002ADD34D7|nr:transcription factor 20 [Syngnathoides biaculeatus]XP_061666746.1 transcription factor 20 [Syngnathoides biaculeatus]
MEQPPGSLDDLQPQDLSHSSISSVIDLTRKGSLSFMSCDVHHLVQSPDWHSNSGLPASSETTTSNASHQSADQIQPDNALSHTTVTLSYVSRSHIFSASQPLTGLPPISKFSLLPSCDGEKGLRGTTYTINQHYLEHIDTPVDLATKAFHSSSKTPEIDKECRPQQQCELIGPVNPSTTIREEHIIPARVEYTEVLENGQDESRSSLGVGPEFSPATDTAVLKKNERKGISEMLLQLSKKEEPVVVQNEVGETLLCSLTRDYKSPLKDPMSPSTTSLGDVEDVFMLPQATTSPSEDHSFQADEVVWDDSITEAVIQLRSENGNTGTSFDSCNENRQLVHTRKPELKPLVDLTEVGCSSGISEDRPKTVTPQMNGNVSVLQQALTKRKLPMRSNRGVRLQSFVMNLNASSYKVSGCINTNLNSSKRTPQDSYTSPMSIDTVSDGKRRSRVKAKQKGVPRNKKEKKNILKTNQCKNTTSNCVNKSKKMNSKNPKFTKSVPDDVAYPGHLLEMSPVRSKKRLCSASNSHFKKSKELPVQYERLMETNRARCSPPALKKSPKKITLSAKGPQILQAAKTKVSGTPKRQRKKYNPGPFTSFFAPKEPEIKLKYIHYKEEKKDFRFDNFSPFIRMHHQQSSTSLCTVVNYPEEARTQHKKGQRELQDQSSSFISGTVPSSSCLQLGRASTQGQYQGSHVCCLCGVSANAMDLGDLHGPYYPEGYRPITKTPTRSPDLKGDKDEYSDSDSSSCSVGGRERKHAALPLSSKDSLANQCWQKGLPPSRQRKADNTGSPAGNHARSEMWPTDVEDWYSPPVLPFEPCEYWLHEDCGIWANGVFLVKGRVYGLEESVKVAKETMCSACSAPGATLGCFFKGCPSKYHYRCALEADCVLIEENFSMKCKKHKNKTLKTPVGMHNDGRRKRPS